MSIDIKPKFISTVPDDPESAADGMVTPSRWNDGSAMTMATGFILGRTSADTGVVEELNAAAAKSLLALTKGDVGLGNVDNTSDANKPVSAATQTALDLKVATTALTDATVATSAVASLLAVTGGGEFTQLSVPFSPNVSATNRFGMLNGGGIFLHENRSAVPISTDKTGLALRTQSEFTYTGGTPGDVVTTQWNQATVSAGVADYVWAGLDIIDNSATAGENVARYMQAKKRSTGPTWGFCVELQDFNDVTGGAVAGEVGLFGNGSVNLANRVGLDLVYRKRDAAGAVMGVGYGLRLNPIVGEALLSNGIYLTGNITNGINIAGTGTVGIRFETTASYTVGINFSLAAGLTAPIRMASDQKIQLDATATMTMGYESAGKFTFENATVEKFSINMTTGAISISGTQVVASRNTGWTADTGTDKKTANATYSGTAEVGYTQATIQALMNAVRDATQTQKAIKDALITHGLIGA